MARNRDPFSLALQTLRRVAFEGGFGPDQPIIILNEARRLKLSTTPVREALAWLGGEGMVERAPNGGYIGLRQDAASVSGRYRLRGVLLQTAVRTCEFDREFDWLGSDAVEVLFARLVRLSADEALWNVYDRVARQLAWLATAERQAVGGYSEHLSRIKSAADQGRSDLLIEALDQFHDLLARGTAAILMAVQVSPPRTEEVAQ